MREKFSLLASLYHRDYPGAPTSKSKIVRNPNGNPNVNSRAFNVSSWWGKALGFPSLVYTFSMSFPPMFSQVLRGFPHSVPQPAADTLRVPSDSYFTEMQTPSLKI